VTVIFSRNGWVRARQGWEVEPSSLSFKEGDSLQTLIKCRTVDPVVFIDSGGRAYTVNAGELPPARGDGAPASSLVELQSGARILFAVGGKADTPVVVASTGGYGFATRIGEMLSNRRAGREFMTLPEGESPLAPVVYDEAKAAYVAAVSEEGRMLVFEMSEVRAVARGRGVIMMGLEKDEKLVAIAVLPAKSVKVRGVRRGKEAEVELSGAKLDDYVGHRARMGRVLPDKFRPSGFGS
jgi:topoisomerase-4 subunit A